MRICSKRPVTKHAKLAQNGVKPASAMPAATPTMFPSAMPSWKKRFGNASPNFLVWTELARSASRTTTFGCVAPTRARASPNAARVAFPATGAPILRSLQFGQGPLELLVVRSLAVPRVGVFHERDTLALDRIGDDEVRTARLGVA